MAFQPTHPGLLTGVVTALTFDDLGAASDQSKSILKVGAPLKVEVKWELDGSFARMLGGDFHVAVFFEGYGTAPEIPLPVVTVAAGSFVPFGSLGAAYTATINAPAGLPAEGVYGLVAMITHRVGGTPTPIAGVVDSQTIIQAIP